MAAWVLGALLAGAASAETGVDHRPPPEDGSLLGFVTNTLSDLDAVASAPVVTNVVDTVTGIADDVVGVVQNAVPKPPAPVVEPPPVPVPPVPAAVASPPVERAAPAAPVRKPAATPARAHKPSPKAPRATSPVVRKPPQVVQEHRAALPVQQSNGPRAQRDSLPTPPAAPSSPACPAAPSPTASPSHDGGGQARAQIGVLSARHQLVPPTATGGAAADALQPPGELTGLLTHTPD
ncbi:hypothetical protein Acsp05_19040 [Actinokineospora sp. NBRC 105648]|nr:hypothetical protein Acsp05_19040 [Actinokineospora sp. NBRC 105648]